MNKRNKSQIKSLFVCLDDMHGVCPFTAKAPFAFSTGEWKILKVADPIYMRKI